MLAVVFLQLAERMAHRHPVAVGDVAALQLHLECLCIAGVERARLDVGQSAPGIAASWLQAQSIAIVGGRFFETAGMHQRVAEQDLWRQ